MTTAEKRFWAKAEAAAIAKRNELFTHNDRDREVVA